MMMTVIAVIGHSYCCCGISIFLEAEILCVFLIIFLNSLADNTGDDDGVIIKVVSLSVS